MRYLRLALIVAAFASAAVAEQMDRSSLYLNDVRSTVLRLQGSGLSTSDEVLAGSALADSNAYQLRLDPSRSSTLTRSFTRTVTDLTSAPLGVAYQEDLKTEGLLSLSRTATLNFTETTTQHADVVGTLLDSRRTRLLALTQAFGQGASAGKMGFTRSVVTSQVGEKTAVTTATEALELASGLAKGYGLSLKATRFASDEKTGQEGNTFSSALTLPFAGGATTWAFSNSETLGNGAEIKSQKLDLTAPFKVNEGAAKAEFHSAFTTTNGVQQKTRTAHLALPFRLFGKVASLDQVVYGEDKGAGLTETRTTRLLSPFDLAGKQFSAEGTFISLRQVGGTITETVAAKLTAPLAHGQATVLRQTVNTRTPTSESLQRQIAVTLPTLNISKNVALTAQHVSTDTVGVGSQDVTSLGVKATPTRPLTVEARCTVNDQGLTTPALTTTQLVSSLALAKNLSLQGQFSEAEVLNAPATSLKLVELVRDRGNTSGIGLRAGLATYGSSLVDPDGARRVELKVGDTENLAVTASYSEYDTNTKASLGADNAVVALSVQHGDPKELSIRYRYEDQPSRVAPVKGVDLACPALGGTLQLGFAANPLAPDGVTVRRADQYDASLARKLFGDVSVQLAYRYLDYDTDGNVDQHVRIQMDGGTEQNWGKLAVAYTTGDFCKSTSVTTASSAVVPGSSLDVSYSRLWGDNGKLSMTLARRTPQLSATWAETVEGRMEYRVYFW